MRKNKENREEGSKKEEVDEVKKLRDAEFNNLKLLILQCVLLQDEVDKAKKGGQLQALMAKGEQQAEILKEEEQVKCLSP